MSLLSDIGGSVNLGNGQQLNTTVASASYPGAVDVGGGSAVPNPVNSNKMPPWLFIVVILIIVGILYYLLK